MPRKAPQKRFMFDLDDERRAKLEVIRVLGGHRSFAAALHALIDAAGPNHVGVVRGDWVEVLSESPAKPKPDKALRSQEPAQSRILQKVGPITDIKTGVTVTHVQVGPTKAEPGSRLKPLSRGVANPKKGK